MSTSAPDISSSTREERLAYVTGKYPCLSDCDLCGQCAVFHGQEPRYAFADYIEGTADFLEVAKRYRR